jgi:hypothetical protein
MLPLVYRYFWWASHQGSQLLPNAGAYLLPKAGATQGRKLLGVGSTAMFGAVWVSRAALAFSPPCSGH